MEKSNTQIDTVITVIMPQGVCDVQFTKSDYRVTIGDFSTDLPTFYQIVYFLKQVDPTLYTLYNHAAEEIRRLI